jgi:hypothetical protein
MKNPRIADGSARNPDDIDAGFAIHLHRILSGENVAAAEDRPIRISLLHLAQKSPNSGTGIFLLDRSAMNANRGVTVRPGFFDDPVEAIDGF